MLQSVERSGELTLALADGGGAGAPLELSARLRELLLAELERGARELGEARTGRERPIVLGVAAVDGAVVVVLPLAPELRADVDAVGERGQLLAVVAVERLVEAGEPGPVDGPDDLARVVG